MADTTEILREHLTNIKNRIAERMATSHRNASGRSVASLKVEVSDGHAVLWGAKSFLVMEKGRGPGAVPAGFIEIIMDWAKAKGISASAKSGQNVSKESAMRSFAGAVAYNIMKKGTKIHRTKQYDDIFTTVLNEELEKMSDAMAISLLDQVSTINDSIE